MFTIQMFGADWCPDCQRAKAFLNENAIEFEYINVDLDEKATKRVEKINKGKRIIPTFEIEGETYTNPNNAELARILGINAVARVIMFGADWCPDCQRAKQYLRDNQVNFMFIDVDAYDWATQRVEQINSGKRIIPTFLIDDQPHTNPDNATLRELLKIDQAADETVYDVAIVGAGAAGLTTAIYAQRDRFNCIMLEAKNVGGNAYLTEKIENYPGFTNISGPDLMKRMAEQAQTYGATIKTGVTIDTIERGEGDFLLKNPLGDVRARSVVLSVGSTYRKLEIPGEEELIGAGIHFCATCDGAFYRDLEVLVIGGGNSALEEGIFLAGFCKKVTIVHRKPTFSASETYIEKLATIDNMETVTNVTSLAFESNDQGSFKSLRVLDNQTGEERSLAADGAFIFIGLIPNTQFLKGVVDLDERGFVKTSGCGVATSMPGIFAAGDCRASAIAQVAAATGEGVVAAYSVRDYLKN